MDRIDQFVTPTERVAAVTVALVQGRQLSTAEVANMVAISHSGAYRMLDRMSVAIPIVHDDGRWQYLPPQK